MATVDLRPGAVNRLAVVLALLVLIGSPAIAISPDSLRSRDLWRAEERDIPLLPVEASGDIQFTLDAAGFLGEDGGSTVELYVAVPHPQLEWVRAGQRYRAEIGIEAELKDVQDRTSRTVSMNRAIEAASFEDTRRVGARTVVVLSTPVSFAVGAVSVEVSDLRSKKRTLLGLLQGSLKSGRARGLLSGGWSRDDSELLSSLVFTNRAAAADEPDVSGSASVHGGMGLWPNPSRFYGYENAIFPAYFEIYHRGDGDGFRDDPTAHLIRYRIASPDGRELLSAADTLEAGAGRRGRLQRFDVSGFGTGTYVLSVELLQGGETEAVRYGEFHVVWTEASWVTDEKTVLEDARVLLDPVEFEDFEARPPGERAAYMASLWESLDPTPGTAANEVRAEFRRRLDLATNRYGGIEGGKLSDRGRVYIRFGEPDEVLHMRQPGHKDTLERWVREEVAGSLGNVIDTSDPRLLEWARRRFDENPAFEIWKYFGPGDPIIPDRAGPPRGMAFIFVDTQGVGVYHLEYTNVTGIR